MWRRSCSSLSVRGAEKYNSFQTSGGSFNPFIMLEVCPKTWYTRRILDKRLLGVQFYRTTIPVRSTALHVFGDRTGTSVSLSTSAKFRVASCAHTK